MLTQIKPVTQVARATVCTPPPRSRPPGEERHPSATGPGARVGRYFGRKLLIYLLTFWVAVTHRLDDPALHARRTRPEPPLPKHVTAGGAARPPGYYQKLFGLDQPIWPQYANFWASLLHGDLGRSMLPLGHGRHRRDPGRAALHAGAARPGDPAQLVGRQQVRGHRRSAEGPRQLLPPDRLHPHRDAVHVARDHRGLGLRRRYWASSRSPAATASRWSRAWASTSSRASPATGSCPFMSLFLVMFGGWAIGMRNVIIYELDADYSRYLGSLGAPAGSSAGTPTATRCCRR